ncbi:hypothetical protein MMC28_008365 [Mycoblastus sanguinarius]|nr:hypothetical protein [Mycoblastus sanguinarius]
MATITAVLASLSTASAAAMLPRSSPAGFFWTFQPEPLDTSFAPLQNGVIQAVNGKFWIGGNYAKSAVLICGANDGSVTNCALSATSGNQPVYIASDGSLSYVAPNAAVPSGNNANVWSNSGSVAYEKTAATSAAQFLASEFVACQTSNGYQLFALQGYQGCAEAEHIFHLSTSATSGDVYLSY